MEARRSRLHGSDLGPTQTPHAAEYSKKPPLPPESLVGRQGLEPWTLGLKERFAV
jgi:hypothetical protein